MKEHAIRTSLVDGGVESHRELAPGPTGAIHKATLAWELERQGQILRFQVVVSMKFRCGKSTKDFERTGLPKTSQSWN